MILFLKIQEARQGHVEGISQWNALVNVFFGEKISINLLFLRYANYYTHLFAVILFSVASSRFLFKRGILDTLERKALYICIIFLFGGLSLSSIIIAYNTLQEFFLIAVVSFFLMATSTSFKKSILHYFAVGVFSFFAIITILPSGILVLGSVVVMLWLKYFKEWKIALVYSTLILLGLLFSGVGFHFFIVDLHTVFISMVQTSKILTSINDGHDFLSMLVKIILYLRDFYMGISLLLGLTAIYFFIEKFSKRWIAVAIFIFSVICFSIYQKKPEMVLTTFIAFPIILLLLAVVNEKFFILKKKNISSNVILYIFLFFLPLISSIGTNVYLGLKMQCFILPWGVLLMLLIWDESIKNKYIIQKNMLLWYFLLMSVNYPIQNLLHDVSSAGHDKLFFMKEKPISQIEITKQQKEYYDNVYHIIKQYGYKKRDVIFSTQLDHMTIVAVDGTPCGLYFLPSNFLIEPNKALLKKPSFLFLTKYDLVMMSDSLKSMDWGFPVAYDSIYVGSPETTKMSYSTERTLYCLKNRNVK